MKSTHFSDKVCWITGASSGIGAALASCLNAMGATLILSATKQGQTGHGKSRICTAG